MIRASVALLTLCVAAGAAPEESRDREGGEARGQTHMSESLRSAISRVAVIGGEEPADQEITGTYEATTPGVYGGISRGAALGSPSLEVGPVNVSVPIPVLTLPGAIAGGISGKAKRELQEFRDALAEELAEAAGQPLSNGRLALGVYRSLDRLPVLEVDLFAGSAPIPEDTDAILYASIDNLSIDAAQADAILTTSASLTLLSKGDGSKLYSRVFAYQDRAALGAWTANDNALIRDYANFALHYLAREMAAESFGRIDLGSEFFPAGSQNLRVDRKNSWQGEGNSRTPTLAWKSGLPDGDAYDAWAKAVDTSAITYDVEIYDNKRLVYAATGARDRSHTVGVALEPCKTYRWSVRPAYEVDGGLRLGTWMRMPSSGSRGAGLHMSGRDAAKAPAYVQDFAALRIDCRAD